MIPTKMPTFYFPQNSPQVHNFVKLLLYNHLDLAETSWHIDCQWVKLCLGAISIIQDACRKKLC